MTPPANAIEVRLDDENVLVGWFTSIDGKEARKGLTEVTKPVLPFGTRFDPDVDDEPVEECRALEIDDRRHLIPGTIIRKTVLSIDDLVKEYAPAYADVVEENDQYGRISHLRVKWHVLVVSMDDYEWMFDLPEFLPKHCGRSDPETTTARVPAPQTHQADALQYNLFGSTILRNSHIVNVTTS